MVVEENCDVVLMCLYEYAQKPLEENGPHFTLIGYMKCVVRIFVGPPWAYPGLRTSGTVMLRKEKDQTYAELLP